MVEQLEDRSFKRLTDKFPVPMLKYLKVKHETAKPYPTKIELENDTRQILDYVLEIFEDKLYDLEFHSSILTSPHLGRYGTYKINLRLDSGKLVYQGILCTADSKLSKRQLCINDEEEVKLNIIFTLEDDADEKIEILEKVINNNEKITNTDIEIIYLTVALYMKSSLTKSELLLKIAELTNNAKGLTQEEKYEIKLFQKAFMRKFIHDNDKLKGEIEKMISINDTKLIQELFPKESEDIMEKGIEKGENSKLNEIAKNMKEQQYDYKEISKITKLSIEEIKKL